MAELFDLDSAGFELDLEAIAIDLTGGFELDLEPEPVNLDCLEYQPADTGGSK